jgi:enoyl-CoA hydratase/carnithine racemase
MLTIASLSGFAIGGGGELATAADFRVWSPSCKLRFVQVKMGVSPGWGGATRLVNLVGERTALRMLASAETIDTRRAMQLGLADHVADSSTDEASFTIDVEGMEQDQTLKAATNWALESFIFRDQPKPTTNEALVGPEDFSPEELEAIKSRKKDISAPPRARNSPLALRSMKRAIWTPEKIAVERKGYERELEQFVLNWGSHYNIEAVNALRKMA